jgi:hypothetical protein
MSASGSGVKRGGRQERRRRGGRRQEGERGGIPGEDSKGKKRGKLHMKNKCSNNIAKM